MGHGTTPECMPHSQARTARALAYATNPRLQKHTWNGDLMSDISALGYLGFTTTDLPGWRTFANDMLGLEVVDLDNGDVALRTDERAWRIRVHAADTDSHAFTGWELPDAEALERLSIRLDAHGVTWREDTELATDRGVLRLLRCQDPDGNELEFFYGSRAASDRFVSPLGHRFVTGSQGLGHIVLYVQDEHVARDFYLNVLGFSLSDMVIMSPDIRVYFTRVNARHHSLAFGHVPGSTERFAHLMLQIDDFDAIGAAYDKALGGSADITQTLGRHTNDRMLSFYMRTPSGFEIEFGTDGVAVEDDSWSVSTYDRPSIWGHEVLAAGPAI
ncbi:hypothetical protein CH298_02305 [Rhodococcoides fascians]|nr:hypothetical protein CH303_02305 [Rhodococcus fascians]OZF23029.1 hypothetical protein CH298_02305 [Rhodococcus fascians]OZF24743.1 hypothetical protein CH297_02305 [Rhodococcus fascians]OZF72992.1 hypothetical protein CH308_02310 [Rhodococcus fascians]OZF74157.1 hypothetical protein CH307_02305 [Rhodococcus fascians]